MFVWLVFIGCCTSTLTSKWAFSVERKKELAFKAAKGKVDHFQCIQSKRKPYVSMKRSFQKLISFEPNMISKKYSASQVLLFSHWWRSFYFEKISFFRGRGISTSFYGLVISKFASPHYANPSLKMMGCSRKLSSNHKEQIRQKQALKFVKVWTKRKECSAGVQDGWWTIKSQSAEDEETS